MRWMGAAILAGALGAPLVAHATETINYTYDARGRLIMVSRPASSSTSTVNAGLTVTYTYDAAGNRTHVTTTGASRNASSAKAATARK